MTILVTTQKFKDKWIKASLAQLELILGGELAAVRHQGAIAAERGTLPSKTDEEWRFTDLSDLLKLNLVPASPTAVSPEQLQPFELPETNYQLLVFVNGFYSTSLSRTQGNQQGSYIGNFKSLTKAQKETILSKLTEAESQEEIFTDLNTSGLQDLAVVWVGKNQTLESPVYLLYLTIATEAPSLVQPRTVVIAETGASLKLVEHYGAIALQCSDLPQAKPYFNNVVTQIWLASNSELEHNRIQRDTGDSFHLASTTIKQSKDSRYNLVEINLGAKLSRHNLEILQQGENTETKLQGLSLSEARQLADTHSLVSLNYPQGSVTQLQKNIIADQAQAVFSGKILVPQAAQLTNADQLNRNILLSPQARVNTKPELQITADNVKCTHGATVSQLETDEIFYLRSRGLSAIEARNLLVDAFAAEIIQQLIFPSLQHRLTQCIACKVD